MDAVAAVPDPRKARRKRHRWALLLTLIAAALVCGPHSGRAIGQSVTEEGRERRPQLPRPPRPCPSTSPLRRALRTIDVEALAARLGECSQRLEAPPAAPPGSWQGHALDGKAVRGAKIHETQVHVVRVVQQGSGIGRKQVRVPDKSNEITVVPP